MLVLAGLAACGGHLYGSELRQRAAFDLSCPKEQLKVTDLTGQGGTGNSQGVSGCGKQATYVFENGKWTKNAETTSPAPAPASSTALPMQNDTSNQP